MEREKAGGEGALRNMRFSTLGSLRPTLGRRMAYKLSGYKGTLIEYDLRAYAKAVDAIRAIDLSGEPDRGLASLAASWRADARGAVPVSPGEGAADGASAPFGEAAIRGMALAAEACRRALDLEPYDEQLAGAMGLVGGRCVQMQTGEGKTLSAAMAASLVAADGHGLHVITANDYLAKRDAAWMGPLYGALGLRAASVGQASTRDDRAEAYGADITYLSAREAGFDYLRDGLAYEGADIVQRGLNAAIVDEADFVLIDEARIPMVLAGEDTVDAALVIKARELSELLSTGPHYRVDREGRRIVFEEAGYARVEALFGSGAHEEAGSEFFSRVYAALHARHLLQRDVDYVIKAGRVALVDGFTGRVADRRKWPYGIQAAIEAKEGLDIGAEGRVFSSMTVRSLMGLYERLAAMTATAVPAAEELSEAYGLSILVIPPAKPSLRIDAPDLLFRRAEEKKAAIVAEIAAASRAGRPVLVGTASVRESRELALVLADEGLGCELLNAADDEREAEKIARAGRRAAVTVSTNMAGRGTDIRLGGPSGDGEERKALEELGGLYVIGTNRHESRRIDDQLRGRAGRQGERGLTRFFISLEDPIFEKYGVRQFLPTDLGGGDPASGGRIDDPRVEREMDRAQAIIEGQNSRSRATLARYTGIVELERRHVRQLRTDALLEGLFPPEVESALDSRFEAGSELSVALRAGLAKAFLSRLDRFWSEQLVLVEEIKEGVALLRYAGKNPGVEFVRRIADSYDRELAEIYRLTIGDSEAMRGGEEGAYLEAIGATAPSATWTYLVEEDELPTFELSSVAGGGLAAVAAGPLLLVKNALAFLKGRKNTRGKPGDPFSR